VLQNGYRTSTFAFDPVHLARSHAVVNAHATIMASINLTTRRATKFQSSSQFIHDRLFDRFPTKGPESRGSGLRLTIARSIVVAHGGEIHASSEPGRGTTMSFTLAAGMHA